LLAIENCKAEYFQACELMKFSEPADCMQEMLEDVAIGNKTEMDFSKYQLSAQFF